MNSDIIRAVSMQLAGAEDNLYRANAAFGRYTQAELDEQHGESGKTRAQLWQEYKDEVARWKQALRDARGEP